MEFFSSIILKRSPEKLSFFCTFHYSLRERYCTTTIPPRSLSFDAKVVSKTFVPFLSAFYLDYKMNWKILEKYETFSFIHIWCVVNKNPYYCKKLCPFLGKRLKGLSAQRSTILQQMQRKKEVFSSAIFHKHCLESGQINYHEIELVFLPPLL